LVSSKHEPNRGAALVIFVRHNVFWFSSTKISVATEAAKARRQRVGTFALSRAQRWTI
jgi:hypothetical protein